jgi:hypothetical protein
MSDTIDKNMGRLKKMLVTPANISLPRCFRFVRRWWVLAASSVFLLLSCLHSALAQDTAALGIGDVVSIVVYGMAHKSDVGIYKGRHVKVTGQFAHLDHFNDYAAAQRTDNARSFEIIVTNQLTPPHGVSDVYIACLLPKDHPYAKLADALPLGSDPAGFGNSSFSLEGDIDNLDYESDTGFAQINLKPGCAVVKP